MVVLKSVIVLFSLCVSAACYAQAKKAPSANKPAKGKAGVEVNAENTLLWEISGKGLKQPSYLYGTMHIVCSEDAKMSDGLKSVINKSQQVFFEVDMDNMEEMMGALKFARMNNGIKISDLVSPTDYEKIEAYFKNNKSIVPFSMMSRFKPYFITAIIGEGIMACKEKSSVEQIIMKEARDNDKDVFGLETIEFQASIFDSIPYEKQAQDLVNYVDSIDKYKQTTLELVDLYRKQDVNKMDELITKSDPGMMQYMDVLLYDRNKRWAAQMPEQMLEKSTLFAVGAGHLGGENGVINLLRKEGYTVKPLDNSKFSEYDKSKKESAMLAEK